MFKFTLIYFCLLSFFTVLFVGCNPSSSDEEISASSTTTTTTTIVGSSTIATTTTINVNKPYIEIYKDSANSPKLQRGEDLNFQSLFLDTTSDIIKLVFKNSGNGDLSIDLNGVLAGEFSLGTLSKSGTLKILKDATTDLTISVTFSDLGDKSGTITIKNDATTDITFNLKAKIIPKPNFISLVGGTFTLGNSSLKESSPAHSVTLGDFKIANYEVTYKLWDDVYSWAVNNGYEFSNRGVKGRDGTYKRTSIHPVTNISWYDAVKWCNAYSQKSGLTPCYYTDSALGTVYKSGIIKLSNDSVKWDANGYRLPTEAEWEYAARNKGVRSGLEYSGSDTCGDVGWYYNNSDDNTFSVGSKSANELDIFDMTGNVSEWCWDWYGEYTNASPYTDADTKGPSSGEYRIVRGGSFLNLDSSSVTSYRFINILPNFKGANVGFRVVTK